MISSAGKVVQNKHYSNLFVKNEYYLPWFYMLSLFSAALKKAAAKRDLWEKARAAFYFFEAPSMETIYRLILAGRQKIRQQLIDDSS